ALDRRAGGVGLCRYRSGAAPAHRRAGHGPDGDRLPVADLRLDPGHGDARPLGSQAHGLSRHPRPARPHVIRLGTIAQYFLRHAFVRFAVIGACGYAVGATILALGTGPLKLDFAEANALAIFIAMAFT